jgi:hypothetical protein
LKIVFAEYTPHCRNRPTQSFNDEAFARNHDLRGDEIVAVERLKSLAGAGPVLSRLLKKCCPALFQQPDRRSMQSGH